jgi:hypothetical protein
MRTKALKLRSIGSMVKTIFYMANIDRRNTKCIVTKASVPNDNTYCGTIERSKGNYFFKPGTKIDTYRVVGS